jgi:hypothetical protein
MGTHELREDAAAERLRRDIEQEREQLVHAVGALRETATTKRVTHALEHRLPVVLGGAFVAGFLVSGGVGAAVRLAFRRGREQRPLFRLGRFAVVER